MIAAARPLLAALMAFAEPFRRVPAHVACDQCHRERTRVTHTEARVLGIRHHQVRCGHRGCTGFVRVLPIGGQQ